MWIQCLITVLGQFFKSFYATKKKNKTLWCGGERRKKAFAVLWLQIITTQWTNICLVNSPITNRVLVTAEPFAISPRATFLCQALTLPSDGPVRREKSCSEGILRPAGSEARTFFNAPSGLRKSQPRNISACRPRPATRCQEIDSSRRRQSWRRS